MIRGRLLSISFRRIGLAPINTFDGCRADCCTDSRQKEIFYWPCLWSWRIENRIAYEKNQTVKTVIIKMKKNVIISSRAYSHHMSADVRPLYRVIDYDGARRCNAIGIRWSYIIHSYNDNIIITHYDVVYYFLPRARRRKCVSLGGLELSWWGGGWYLVRYIIK